mmetsp:Transcript_45379/g.146234  ORF Transcript_45379/g.146234 Transcript_45379/m.146234 type:complete len:223 (+) Transcript_45379:1105-1773(+)
MRAEARGGRCRETAPTRRPPRARLRWGSSPKPRSRRAGSRRGAPQVRRAPAGRTRTPRSTDEARGRPRPRLRAQTANSRGPRCSPRRRRACPGRSGTSRRRAPVPCAPRPPHGTAACRASAGRRCRPAQRAQRRRRARPRRERQRSTGSVARASPISSGSPRQTAGAHRRAATPRRRSRRRVHPTSSGAAAPGLRGHVARRAPAGSHPPSTRRRRSRGAGHA